MQRFYHLWRWYTIDEPQYKQSIDKLFYSNLDSLRTLCKVVIILVSLFFFVPIIVDQDFVVAIVYLSVAISSMALFFISTYLRKKHQQNRHVSRFLVFGLITASYAIIIFFGIYLSVFINPYRPASVYLAIVVVALFFFTLPPPFKLTLTLIGWFVFLAISIWIKEPYAWTYDIYNSAAAITFSLIVGWHGSMLRIISAHKTIILENERNAFEKQSTEDELTKLKNRRDFMQNLNRYLNRPRYADDAFCLAIADIDYFKNYNDCYGHSKGDECLRAVGRVLMEVGRENNIYTARIGGEEFALLWFVDKTEEVENILEQIHTAIKALNIPHTQSEVSSHVTISIGAYMLNCRIENDFNTVYERADKALYKAKRTGRNRSIINDGRKTIVKF